MTTDDKQKTLNEIREDKCRMFLKTSEFFENMSFNSSYKNGFDAGVAEMKKRAEVLADSHKAIAESLRKENLLGIANILDSTLESYRKGTE